MGKDGRKGREGNGIEKLKRRRGRERKGQSELGINVNKIEKGGRY